MTDTFGKFLRVIAVSAIALVGFLMAIVLLVSTAVAVGIFYLIAKVRGKPFIASSYWNQAMSARGGFKNGFVFRPGMQQQGQSRAEAPSARPQPGRPGALRAKGADVTDVEVREVR